MIKVKAKIIKGFCYIYHCPQCRRLFKVNFKRDKIFKCVCGKEIQIEYPKDNNE